jgi:predicted nuclease with TOPRIM domain
VKAQIEGEKRRRQGLLQDQVLKENKIRKLRGRVSEIDTDRYPEALNKLEKEESKCMEVRDRVLSQIHDIRSRLVNFRSETEYS